MSSWHANIVKSQILNGTGIFSYKHQPLIFLLDKLVGTVISVPSWRLHRILYMDRIPFKAFIRRCFYPFGKTKELENTWKHRKVPIFLGNGLAVFRGFKLMEINSNGCFPGKQTSKRLWKRDLFGGFIQLPVEPLPIAQPLARKNRSLTCSFASLGVDC